MIVTIDTPAVFRPLLCSARYKGAYGGRGSAKSWFFASAAIEAALCRPGLRILCAREVQRTLKESSKRLIEDRIQAMGVGAHFDVTRDEIRTPGGGVIIFSGLQDHTAESIKSLEAIDICWLEEAQVISERSLELLRPTIRKPGSEIWASWNSRSPKDPIDQLFRGSDPHPSMVCVKANWSDNPFFSPELEAERLHDKKTKPHRYQHIWEGAYEPHNPDAIWTWDSIHGNRIGPEQAPKMARILVGVDHAVSETDQSDEHGIAVCSLGEDKRGYLLADMSVRGGPAVWSRTAIAAYDRFDADAIVIERNQGGDLVRHTLQALRPNIKIIEVVATRGKHVRAEPIAALYAMGKISHVGTFPEIEQQMMDFGTSGYQGLKSPDRAEAVIWAFSQLFPSIGKTDDGGWKRWQAGGTGWMG